jgi:hypothetical protein
MNGEKEVYSLVPYDDTPMQSSGARIGFGWGMAESGSFQAECSDFCGLQMLNLPMPRWFDTVKSRLEDLQRVSMGYKQDLPAGIPAFEIADQRCRSC